MPLNVVVSHSGKQHAYRHALALQRLGALRWFITSSYYAPSRWPDRWLSRVPALDRYLRRRHLDGLADRVIRQPLFELPEVLCRAAGRNGAWARDFVLHRDALFDRWVAAAGLIPAASADVFWGFQGSCSDSLLAARAHGLTALVELATGHAPAAERILGRERERSPEWADSISNAGFPRWYTRRLEAETERADYCVVASAFTRRTLCESGVSEAKIRLLPLGADLDAFTFRRRSPEGPFQILFVGGVGQRKGIRYLLEAFDRIRSRTSAGRRHAGVRLVVAGPMVGSGRAFRAHARHVDYVGRVNPARVVQLMHESHVLALPSLFEGFGLVIVEAMATGMPVVASTHSAAPEIVREGRDGYVVSPDDVEALADRLTRLAEDRQGAVEMGVEAARRARAYGWGEHAHRLRVLCREIADRRAQGPGTLGGSERHAG